jgi:hypothetical protein
MEFRGLTTNMRAKLRYRTADVLTSRPNAWNDSSTSRSSNGTYVEDVDLSAVTTALWVQAGIGVATASSAQVGEALATLRSSTKGLGQVVAADKLEIGPDINTSQTGHQAIGAPFSALGLAAVMAGVVATGVAGTLDYGLVIRYFDGDINAPGAWVDVVAVTGITSDEIRNFNDTAVTPGTKLLAQLGIKWGGTSPQATLKVVASGRWS